MTDGVLLKEVQQVSLRALSLRDDPFQPLMIDGIFKHFDTFGLKGRTLHPFMGFKARKALA